MLLVLQAMQDKEGELAAREAKLLQLERRSDADIMMRSVCWTVKWGVVLALSMALDQLYIHTASRVYVSPFLKRFFA